MGETRRTADWTIRLRGPGELHDILLLVEYSLDGEWEGQVRYLPLR